MIKQSDITKRDKRIEELKAQLNEYKDSEHRAVKSEGEALKALEAVKPFTSHTPECKYSDENYDASPSNRVCTCGLEAAIKGDE